MDIAFRRFFFVFLLLPLIASALYEDQVGKFDWIQRYVGKIRSAAFFDQSADQIIVATEDHVLAALKSGNLHWRKVLEIGDRGDIKLLVVNSNDHSLKAVSSHLNREHDIITVSGHNPALIRGWNADNTALDFEWYLSPLNPAQAVDAVWFYSKGHLYHVIPVWSSHLELTVYVATSGERTKETSTKISAGWIRREDCVLTGSYFACVSKSQVVAINLASEKNEIVTRPLNQEATVSPKAVAGLDGALQIGDQLILLKEGKTLKLKPNANAFIDRSFGEVDVLVQAVLQDDTKLFISASTIETNEPIDELTFSASYPKSSGPPEIAALQCKRETRQCNILLSSQDGAIILLQQNKIKWIREEALARVVTSDFVDLALSDAEGELEEELKNKDGDVFGAMVRRISSQISHAKNLFLHVLGLGPPPSASQKAGLVRDDFGLHKIIVVVTEPGKIFGIDNLTGKIHWMKYLPNVARFNKDQEIKLLVQRTSKFYPLPPQCAIVGKNRATGNGIIYQFNPLNGQPLSGGLTELNYPIQQLMLLHELNEDYLKGILLLDNNGRVYTIPDTSAKQAHGIYLFTADRNTGVVTGYLVEHESNHLQASRTWLLHLGGAQNSQKIIKVVSKNPLEHVHSQGRVLADRSVLYKYLNPNLVAFATQGPDSVHKYILNVHLIDVVSGAIVFSMTHRRITGPIQMVHSENWLAYTYYNDKVRRNELTSIELYEGKTQANSTIWTSLGSPPMPLIERQSYIVPTSGVVALKETITEKGITNKHILFGLNSGAVVELTWALLDPRRPSTNTERAREEGIIPYIPELPLPAEATINYNQTIHHIQGIQTSPSGLESTCLVLVHGLDIFVTRVAPSKTFDLLKDDFDYYLISIVLIGLVTAAIVTKQLASRKIVKQAWK